MNLQTFKAATMAEALTQVKTTMGADAVILHTRTFFTRHWLGLRRREMVEITAGKGLNVGRRRYISDPAPSPAQQRSNQRSAAGIAAYRSGGGGTAPAPSRALTTSRGDSPDDSFAGGASISPRNAVQGSPNVMETPA